MTRIVWKTGVIGRFSEHKTSNNESVSPDIFHLEDEAEDTFDSCIFDIVDSGELVQELPSEDDESSGMQEESKESRLLS